MFFLYVHKVVQPSLAALIGHFLHSINPVPISSYSLFSPNSPSSPLPSPQPRQPLVYVLSTNLPILDISFTWNHIICCSFT